VNPFEVRVAIGGQRLAGSFTENPLPLESYEALAHENIHKSARKYRNANNLKQNKHNIFGGKPPELSTRVATKTAEREGSIVKNIQCKQ
jgi:hypothetical protein